MTLMKFSEVRWISEKAEEFANYWRSLPAPQRVPYQFDFNPAAVPLLLPRMSIYELKDDKEIICRLMGTGLVEFFGKDVTDQNILNLLSEQARPNAFSALNSMLEVPYGMLMTLVGHTESGEKIRSMSIGFPALDPKGDCKRLIFKTYNIDYSGHRNSREDQVVRIEVEEQGLISLD